MYSEKLAIAVKHNGRVLREHGDTVHLPFGSEYSLHFKNLNSVRALVRVSVDGQDATEGTSLIVPANGTVELERFIKGGNLSSGHKFKFIERTSKIENGPRGIKSEDGLIRVEFEFERQPAKIEYETIKKTYVEEYWKTRPWPVWYYPSYTVTSTPFPPGEILCSAVNGVNGISASDFKIGSVTANISQTCDSFGVAQNASASASLSSNTATYSSPTRSTKLGSLDASNMRVKKTFVPPQVELPQLNDVGITVAGSESDQKFQQGAWFPTDGQKHVMVLKLLGVIGEKAVQQPVTVKTKQECPTCGTKNKHGTKFCRECGTNLAA